MAFIGRFLFVLLGLIVGGVVGFWIIIAILKFIFPMFGWTDEMSIGIGGFHLLVFLGPIFVTAGGLVAFFLSRKRCQ